MRRPLPTLPRGPGRRRAPRSPAQRHLLACPRVSPEWELGALRALMKPHEWTRGAIEHRPAEQPWPPGAARAAEETMRVVADRLGAEPLGRAHFPEGGDFWLVVEVSGADLPAAKGLAVALSRRLPGLWFTLDRLYVLDGRFYRRKRDNTFKFRLVPAPHVHIPRDVRSALRGVL